MSAYVIADIDITDPQLYAEYRKDVPASIARHGGRFLVRGGAVETLEGEWKPGRVVILEFPDAEHLEAWYRSPEYQALLAIRQRASRGSLIRVQGV